MRKGGMSKAYSDSGSRTSTSSPRRSKANHSILKVEGDLEKEFEIHPYPTPAQYQQLATRLKVEKNLYGAGLLVGVVPRHRLSNNNRNRKKEKNAGGAAGNNSTSMSKVSKTTSDGKVSSSPGGTAKDYGQSSGSNSTTSSPSSIDSNNTLNDHLTSKLKTQKNKTQLTRDGGNSGHGI